MKPRSIASLSFLDTRFLYTRPIMKKSTLVLVLVATLALAFGAYFYQLKQAPEPLAPLNTALRYPEPRSIDPFVLNVDGNPTLRESDLTGHYTLLFFGFTKCPDVCPLTLSTLAQAYAQWPTELAIGKPEVIFVSVDPERDSLQASREYVEFFNPDFRAATGSLAELEAFTRQLGVVFMKQPTEETASAYTIDHSASLLLVNPKGELIALIRPPFETRPLRDDLLALVGS